MTTDLFKDQITKEFDFIQPLIDYTNTEQLPFFGYDISKNARDQLPIYQNIPKILFKIKQNEVLLLNCPQTFGLSTQLPQILFSAHYANSSSSILVVHPSNLLTLLHSKRVADEMHAQLGQSVGYVFQFHHASSSNTKLKFISTQSFFTEFELNRLLLDYSIIILDDFDTSVLSELALMFLVQVIQNRRSQNNPPLKLVINSRGQDNTYLLNYLTNMTLKTDLLTIKKEGSVSPKFMYLNSSSKDILTTIEESVYEFHLSRPLNNNILIFLSSNFEVEEIQKRFTKKLEEAKVKNCQILKIHSGLKIAEQMACFDKTTTNQRTIIFTTNVCLNLKLNLDIHIVIDSLMEVNKEYDSKLNAFVFRHVFISKSKALQRSSKINSTTNPICVRLCKETHFIQLTDFDLPRIYKTSAEEFYLTLKMLAVTDLFKLNWLRLFPKVILAQTLENLFKLSILDSSGQPTTKFGDIVVHLQLPPRLSVMILNSFKPEFQCSAEILALAAMLSVGPVFKLQKDPGQVIANKKKVGAKEGDLLTLVNVFQLFKHRGKFQKNQLCSEVGLRYELLDKAVELNEKLTSYFQALGHEVKSSKDDVENIQRCIFWSLESNVAYSNIDQTYTLLNGGRVAYLQPSSVLNTSFPRWLVFFELVSGLKNEDKVFLSEAVEIREEWISEKREEDFKKAETLRSAQLKMVEKVQIKEKKTLLFKEDVFEKIDVGKSKKVKSNFLSAMEDYDV